MSADLLTVSDIAGVDVALLPGAEQTKRALLQGSRIITTIEDAFDAECAADVLGNISRELKAMEDARKAVKAPVLELGKRIDALAKEWANEIEAEKTRISRVLGDYQLAERKKKEAAERAARQAEWEARRKAQEALDKGDLEGAEAAADEIAKPQAVVAESSHQIAGTAVRETYQFEVTDINALFKAAPHLCKIEPDNAAIRAAIKKTQPIPGLRIWKEAKSYSR